jgi:hypothetical protein
MPLTKFNVLNRLSSDIQFTAEIECDESASGHVNLGLRQDAVTARAYVGSVLSRRDTAPLADDLVLRPMIRRLLWSGATPIKQRN